MNGTAEGVSSAPDVTSLLPIAIEDLLHARSVESERIEFKAAWCGPTKAQIVRSVCAFANDLRNLGGGYIILGVSEGDDGPRALGLDEDVDALQKDVLRHCEAIQPKYHPIPSPEAAGGRSLLVLWCPGGDHRPYEAPDGTRANHSALWVRKGPTTRKATPSDRQLLLEQAARVPWDDRRALSAAMDALSPRLVREHLLAAGSAMDIDTLDTVEVFRRLRLLVRVKGHEVPRNVALLFFAERPHVHFPGARIEIAIFPDGAAGDEIDERQILGPLPVQLRSALDTLAPFNPERVTKDPAAAEARRVRAWPLPALEEAIANAVYHRGYESEEPVKVHVHPDRIEVLSYPGPVAGLRPEDLEGQSGASAAPARNRRIGDLLKELRLVEARGTGVPKIRRAMELNGSPPPRFEFDEEHTWFRVTLPIHPLLRARSTTASVRARQPTPGTPTRLPLGREPLIDRITPLIGVRPLLLHGARGVGVSSVLRAVHARLPAERSAVLLELHGEPAIALPRVRAAAERLGERLDAPGDSPLLGEQRRLLNAIRQLFEAHRRHPGTTLFIDGAHQLLRLAQADFESPIRDPERGTRWFVETICGSDGPSPDLILATDGPALAQLLGEEATLLLVDRFRRVAVPPLGREQAVELARELLRSVGGPAELAEGLAGRCEGHPGALHHLAEELSLGRSFTEQEAADAFRHWRARGDDPGDLERLEGFASQSWAWAPVLWELPASRAQVENGLATHGKSRRRATRQLWWLEVQGLVVERDGQLALPWEELREHLPQDD